MEFTASELQGANIAFDRDVTHESCSCAARADPEGHVDGSMRSRDKESWTISAPCYQRAQTPRIISRPFTRPMLAASASERKGEECLPNYLRQEYPKYHRDGSGWSQHEAWDGYL